MIYTDFNENMNLLMIFYYPEDIHIYILSKKILNLRNVTVQLYLSNIDQNIDNTQ
jgi:hypothetical protein